mmetsp:Transcript_15303/g.27279  ORF Transcript_15303/g.27279 Transcript_15303/m.27279 type:complete len:148 (+) Transcript_15303:77-520(+)
MAALMTVLATLLSACIVPRVWSDDGLKAVTPSVHRFDEGLRSDMRRMMDEEDGDYRSAVEDRPIQARGGNFLQVSSGMHVLEDRHFSVLDEYIKESEEGLSAALGPRWDARKLEKDADESSKALLEGIGGSRALRVLNGMAGALNLR